MDIVVLGSFNTDLMSRTPHLPKPGETVMGGPFAMGAGGKGCNQATAAAKLGLRVAMVARLGDDAFAQIAMDNFKQNGVLAEHVITDAQHHTGVALIEVDDKAENSIVVAPGANEYFTQVEIDHIKPLIEQSKILLMQLEINQDAIDYAAKIAHEAGVTVVLNPAPARALSDALLGCVDILTPNETEAEILTGIVVRTVQDAEQAARALQARGVTDVIITLGANGSYWLGADGGMHIPSMPVDAVDTTGAGDAFSGALCAGLAQGKAMQDAIALATAVAALSVTKVGTSPAMPTQQEVDAFVAGVRP